MSASQTIDNDAGVSVDNRNKEGVNTDMNNSTKPGNNPQLIVSALLTFIISLLHSAASANRLVEIICKFYDNDEIKNAKCLLCDVSNIALYTVMKTPPWKLIVPTVCFHLCKYKKSETDPTSYHFHYSELLESFTDYTPIFTDGSKNCDRTAVAYICQSFEFSKRLPDKASILTAELEAIVSALRYIKITTKNNKFVVFGDSESALQALLSKWDHPTVQTIMRFLVFLHTVHETVVGYPVIWEFLETNVLILQRKLHYRRMFLIV